MAILGLHLSRKKLILRKFNLTNEITNLQDQKTLAAYSQLDADSLKSCKEAEIKRTFKALFKENEEYQEKYTDYTQIVEYNNEMDKITAEYNEELAKVAAWELAINQQITTDSQQLTEIEGYLKSEQSMLQGNIQNDFKLSMS